MVTANTTGKQFSYFRRINVANAAFNSDADVVLNFRGRGSFTLQNEGTGIIEYSFNGNILHGDSNAAKYSGTLTFTDRAETLIWFRLKSGTASDIRIEAWARV